MPSAQYASPKKAQRHTTWHHIFAKCRLIGDQRIGKSTAWQNRAGADCPSWVKRGCGLEKGPVVQFVKGGEETRRSQSGGTDEGERQADREIKPEQGSSAARLRLPREVPDQTERIGHGHWGLNPPATGLPVGDRDPAFRRSPGLRPAPVGVRDNDNWGGAQSA